MGFEKKLAFSFFFYILLVKKFQFRQNNLFPNGPYILTCFGEWIKAHTLSLTYNTTDEILEASLSKKKAKGERERERESIHKKEILFYAKLCIFHGKEFTNIICLDEIATF